MIFEYQGHHIELRQIKTSRLSVRRKAATRFIVHGPKTMSHRALKQMIMGDFESLLKLPVPFDYTAYLSRPKGHVFGQWTAWDAGTLNDELMQEIRRLDGKYQRHQSAIDLTGVTYTVKPYQSKFGSCHPKRKIIRFNQMLVHYPKPFIEAIYAHEITHLNEPHHQAPFYQLLTTIYPTYRADQAALKSVHRSFLKGMYDFTSITYP